MTPGTQNDTHRGSSSPRQRSQVGRRVIVTSPVLLSRATRIAECVGEKLSMKWNEQATSQARQQVHESVCISLVLSVSIMGLLKGAFSYTYLTPLPVSASQKKVSIWVCANSCTHNRHVPSQSSFVIMVYKCGLRALKSGSILRVVTMSSRLASQLITASFSDGALTTTFPVGSIMALFP